MPDRTLMFVIEIGVGGEIGRRGAPAVPGLFLASDSIPQV